ncbi:hypothetical protein Avbf_18886 [Armadillidium vulgare]|nr:hypothetical protein Avbf_18886 [Armadillidium vulgare]
MKVNSSMTATLSADRRQKIVVDHSPIAEIIETWPLLKDENKAINVKIVLFQEFTPTPNIKYVEDILRVSNKVVEASEVSAT